MESQLNKQVMEESPKSAEKLEQELEQIRAKLYDSQGLVQVEKNQLSAEKAKNSDLKDQTARWRSPSPGINRFDLETENNELEKRLQELEVELRLERANQVGGSYSPASPRALESRYQNADPANFLQSNQQSQLEHLQNLKKIFETESLLIKERMEANQVPTEADLLTLRSRMGKVRQEIDSILRAKVRLNERYNNMAGRIDILQRENESLRSSQSRASDTSHLADISREIATRNAKIAELTAELHTLKALLGKQVSSGELVDQLLQARRESDSKSLKIQQLEQSLSNQLKIQLNLSQTNQTLSSQLVEIKAQIDSIDVNRIKKDMADAASKVSSLQKENRHLKQANESSRDTIDTLRNKVRSLEAENKRLSQQVPTGPSEAAGFQQVGVQRTPLAQDSSLQNSELKPHLLVTPKPFAGGEGDSHTRPSESKIRPGETASTHIGEMTTVEKTYDHTPVKMNRAALEDMRQSQTIADLEAGKEPMGVVSLEEMVKLEDRIKEFGDCNQELEDLIYKVKHLMLGMDDADQEDYQEVEEDMEQTNQRWSPQNKKHTRADVSQILGEVYQMKGLIQKLANESRGQQTNTNSDSVQTQMLMQLELMRMQNKKQEEVDIRVHLMIQENKKLSDEISQLKERLRDSEIKANTLVALNLQNESQIERLLQQINDNKECFKKLITENETVKVREREILRELTNTNSKLQQMQYDPQQSSSSKQAYR